MTPRGTDGRTRGRAATTVVLALVAALLAAGVAAGHGVRRAGVDEPTLRRIEQRMLGDAHAREHAAQRRRQRAGRRTPRRRVARAAQAAAPADVGAWSAGLPHRLTIEGRADRTMPAVHAALMPTGDVLFLGYPVTVGGSKEAQRGESFAVVWTPGREPGQPGRLRDVPLPKDPATGKPVGIWCGGTSNLADGRVLVTGGWEDYSKGGAKPGGAHFGGLDHIWTFDPFARPGTDPWQYQGKMREGRWYPSQLLTPDGRTVIVQGYERDQGFNPDVELLDAGLRGERSGPGGYATDLAATLPADQLGWWYPHTFWMPSGFGLIAGPDPANSSFLALDPHADRIELIDAPNQVRERVYSSAVLLPLRHDSEAGQVLQLGGFDAYVQKVPEQGAELFTERGGRGERPTGTWSSAPGMLRPRAFHNTVLLPDSTMVNIGGANELGPDVPERTSELWDGERWRFGPTQDTSRAYHSTALLLPDGTVVSAGGDDDSGKVPDSYEVYRPPYLFKRGPRPAITAAPESTGYGRTLRIEADVEGEVARAALVTPGAVTHSVDMSQRLVELPVRRRADGHGYDVTTPAHPDVAVPGFHMLFLVDDRGRVSEARWIRLDGGAPEQAPPPVTEPRQPERVPDPPTTTVPVAPPVQPPRREEPRPPVDRTAPRVTATLAARSVRTIRRGRAVTLAVALDEAGTADVAASLTVGRRAVARWRSTVTAQGGRAARVRLVLDRRQRARLRAGAALTVTVLARDAAGNTARRTVRARLAR